jgi:hypothetical protein
LAREVAAIARRERRSSGFSPVAPLDDEVAEMAGRQRSTEVVGGAPMGRWFWTQGGEIGARVGAVENGGALGGFYRAVGRRKAGGRGEGGGGGGTSMAPVMGNGNGEGEATGCGRFRRGRGGGGEAALR